jgi:hypothetical protein
MGYESGHHQMLRLFVWLTVLRVGVCDISVSFLALYRQETHIMMTRGLLVGTVSFIVPFTLSLSYPVAVIAYLPKSTQPVRWIQNNPSFSVFLLSVFPLAVAIFSVSVNAQVIEHWSSEPWHFWIACVAVTTSIAIATLIVIDDFRGRLHAPYILKAHLAVKASLLEKELRTAARSALKDKKLGEKRSNYQHLIQIKTFQDFRAKAGPIAYIHLGLVWIANVFAVCYLWYLIAAAEFKVYHHVDLGRANESQLLLIYLLLITWFPMRLHTEWYQNYFHKRDWLSSYPAFWLLATLALAGLLLVAILMRPEGLLQFIPIFNVVLVALLGLIGKLKPEWLRVVADFLESTPFIYFIAIYFVFVALICLTTAITILNKN